MRRATHIITTTTTTTLQHTSLDAMEAWRLSGARAAASRTADSALLRPLSSHVEAVPSSEATPRGLPGTSLGLLRSSDEVAAQRQEDRAGPGGATSRRRRRQGRHPGSAAQARRAVVLGKGVMAHDAAAASATPLGCLLLGRAGAPPPPHLCAPRQRRSWPRARRPGCRAARCRGRLRAWRSRCRCRCRRRAPGRGRRWMRGRKRRSAPAPPLPPPTWRERPPGSTHAPLPPPLPARHAPLAGRTPRHCRSARLGSALQQGRAQRQRCG